MYPWIVVSSKPIGTFREPGDAPIAGIDSVTGQMKQTIMSPGDSITFKASADIHESETGFYTGWWWSLQDDLAITYLQVLDYVGGLEPGDWTFTCPDLPFHQGYLSVSVQVWATESQSVWPGNFRSELVAEFPVTLTLGSGDPCRSQPLAPGSTDCPGACRAEGGQFLPGVGTRRRPDLVGSAESVHNASPSPPLLVWVRRGTHEHSDGSRTELLA